MLQLTLILSGISTTLSLFAPAVMPLMYAGSGIAFHKLNASASTQEMILKAMRKYLTHVSYPNSSWTTEDWDRSLEVCRKLREETRKSILLKTPHDELKNVERFIETNEKEDSLVFNMFLSNAKRAAKRLNISHTDVIIETFRKTLNPECLREMPQRVMEPAWNKCREALMSGVSDEEKPKLGIFLRKMELYELPSLSNPEKQPKLKLLKPGPYRLWCAEEAARVGIKLEDRETLLDLLEEERVHDEMLDKSHWTPKQWNDYRSVCEDRYRQMVERAVAIIPTQADQVREVFERVQTRNDRMKAREKLQYFKKVEKTASLAQLSKNTTDLMIHELKMFHTKVHSHVGFATDDEIRADQELIMSYGIIKMRLIEHIPRDEQENVTHFFFMLSRDRLQLAHEPILNISGILRYAAEKPFENYTVSVADNCRLSNESLYLFLEAHMAELPTYSAVKELNRLEYFERRLNLIDRWLRVKYLTTLVAADTETDGLNCFFRTIEEEFVKARRTALYKYVQSDEMHFVGISRKEIRMLAKQANVTKNDTSSMIELVKTLKPAVSLPDSGNPTLEQVREAYSAAHSFKISFKDECYASIKDREALDRFFAFVSASHKLSFAQTSFDENGFICCTPHETVHPVLLVNTRVRFTVI